MKNSYLLILFLLLSTSISFAQKVNFERSFELAKTKGLQQKKPIMFYINITPPTQVQNYMDGTEKKEVIDMLNSNFVNYKINRTDSNARSFISKYRINRFPAYIFFDYEGGLLMKEMGVISNSTRLMSMFNQALALSKGKTMNDYEKIYQSDSYDISFLRAYIEKREQAGISDHSEIIEKYVSLLQVSDLGNYDEVLFILKAGPLVDGKAYRLAWLNPKLVDSVYKNADLETRIKFNNSIINNSLSSAIKNKSFSRAIATANFTRSTWKNDYNEASKSYAYKLVQYYGGIKDTLNYLKHATNYYDRYYMHISVDSIKKLDSLKRLTQRKELEKQIALTKSKNVNNVDAKQTTVIRAVTAYTTSTFSSELNNAAYAFYLTGTKNQAHLLKAMNWSRRSIDLNPIYGYYDTLAHIYYRLGFFLEAESTQKKAIDLANKQKLDLKHLKEELEKMRAKSL